MARGQITITEVQDGAAGTNGTDGKTYIGVINGGVRSITFDANGSNPTPTQSAFSCQLYQDGSLVTPETYAWSASGHLSGTSSNPTFTPTCSGTFDASNNDTVSLSLTYSGQTIKMTIPIAATKIGNTGAAGVDANLLPWISAWNNDAPAVNNIGNN
ncbi:MAG: hypothetical protein M0R38_12160, partial [Bacteroidia bacterium]|nr:hypothetical protein [Bacteroidia bacterium]